MTLVCVALAGFATTQTARAQTAVPDATPEASPAINKPAAASQQRDPAQSASQLTTSREKRAQAYAKLLEGQRYLSNIGPNPTESAVRLAEQAFRQAATLDPTLAEAHTALAEIAFFYSRDFDLALREATLATGVDRDNFGAHRLLSRVYSIKSGLRENKLDKRGAEKAIAELREVARLDPSDAEAWALLGELYYALGRNSEAIDAWTRWAAAPAVADSRVFQFITNGRELSPDTAAARLGEAFISAGRVPEAIASIRRAMSLNPENKDYVELLGRALEAGEGGDSSAIAELQRMVSADPGNTSLVRLLARAQARSGQVEEAAATLRTAMARREMDDRERLLLRLYLAQVFSDAMRYTDAIGVYEELLKERGVNDSPPSSEDEREFAGQVLQQIIGLQKSAGRTDEMAATIERMRRLLGKDDPSADIQYIQFLRDQGKRREAMQAAHAARQRFPEQSEFVRLEAETLTDLGRVDDAVALMRTRLKGALEDFDVYLTVSGLYVQAGRGREGVLAARKALELAPPDRQDLLVAALITLSSAQERAGDTKGSEESLRSVLAIKPNDPTALNNLGYFLVERNERLPEALQMIQRAVQAEPTNSSFLDSLGWAYFKLGKLDEAERHLRQAALRDATSATIQEHLGDVYHQRGQTDLALAAWQRALSLSVEAGEVARIRAKLGNKK
jgi:tetratricopeptide (TPR) repeat protein